MSGIATATRQLVEKLRKANLHTRRWRRPENQLRLGSISTRKPFSLAAATRTDCTWTTWFSYKDNHIAIVGSVEAAVKRAKKNASFTKKIEVEVTKAADAVAAAKAGADIVMLDNFSPKQIKDAIEMLKKTGFLGKVLVGGKRRNQRRKPSRIRFHRR